MDDKKRLLLIKSFGIIFIAAIVVFLITLFISEISQGTFNAALFFTLLPAAGIVAFFYMFLKRTERGVKSGLPLEDELSKRVKERAGYLTYMITVYFILALMWYNFLVEDYGFPVLLARHLTFVMLFFMLGVFSALWLVFSRRGIK